MPIPSSLSLFRPRLLDAAVISFDAEEADSWFSPNRF
ncbi:hypothetical protein Tco_0225502, partial [Tanacetum coccineum]